MQALFCRWLPGSYPRAGGTIVQPCPLVYDLFGMRGNHVTQVYMCVPAEHDVWQPSTSLSLSLFLRINLYELMKNNSFQGFSLSIVRRFTFSVLKCLQMLYVEKIIHCDLKPVSTSWPAGGAITGFSRMEVRQCSLRGGDRARTKA